MTVSLSPSALRMSALKVWQLKHCAFLTGQPVSGNKAELQANLLHHLEQLPDGASRPKRIVSVDMGIRNLAFCAVDIPSLDSPSGERIFKVDAWKRTDLTQTNQPYSETPSNEEVAESEDSTSKHREKGNSTDPSLYAPSSLAKIATSLTHDLSTYSPNAVLIERQRFRTSGHAAIQEWTVRVNMLEAMLWSSFETLRRTNPSTPSLHEISPARVANFWVAGKKISLDPPPGLFSSANSSEKTMYDIRSGRKKIDKAEKVDIVRSWVAGQSDVQLAFTEETANVADAFQRTSTRNTGKLDDLADCLLQAIAWFKWGENQRNIKAQWDETVADLEAFDDSSNKT